MKVKCNHGYYIFEETKPGQVSDFIKLSGYDISRGVEGYTFTALLSFPKYVIKGNTYLGAIASKTFEGLPSEIFKENGWVFDFTKNKLMPIASMIGSFELRPNGNYFTANGLILAGTKSDDKVVKSYSGFFSRINYVWTYSEVERG